MIDYIKLLHVYGQGVWHDDVYIVGNRESLEDLRAAIDAALDKGEGSSKAFTSDGEGFSIGVFLEDAEWQTEEWMKLPMPYTEDMAKEQREWDSLRKPWIKNEDS